MSMTASMVITPEATQEQIEHVLAQLAWTINNAKKAGRQVEVTVARVEELRPLRVAAR